MSTESSAIEGLRGVTADLAADKQAFPVPWGKAMMWRSEEHTSELQSPI